MMGIAALVVVLLAAGIEGHRVARIVNGDDAQLGEFPGTVSLHYGISHIGGAAVLNDNWGITAAHTVDGFPSDMLTLLVGTIHQHQGGTIHAITEYILHPEYNSKVYWNDIALLKVTKPFDFGSANLQPVVLATPEQDPADGTTATVVGWGLNEVSVMQWTLQKVDINIVNQEACDELYDPEGLPIIDGEICAGVQEGRKGTCNGDAGDPLYVDGVVVGITSRISECSTAGRPDIFARMSHYRDWIKEVTGA